MIKQQEQVREFHRVFGHPVADEPTNIPVHRAAERLLIMSEELDEYEVAVSAGDLVEVADALADLLYTIYGTFVEHGVTVHFGPTQRSKNSEPPRLVGPESFDVEVLVGNLADALKDYVFHAVRGDISEVKYSLHGALVAVGDLTYLHRIDLEPVFEIVHASNMSKLGEDGKPVPHPTIPGKSGKGPNFWEPQDMIRNELEVQGWKK